ncbi:MAG: hypothetical protein B7C24_07770 [Bacteroidetes bacterium 4572_77]|nr:MAG: hypothetical protein B7C24_07770 [Bacteroidetes bacterium 4572_77]
MYKGKAQPQKLLELLEISKHPIAYNGDIFSAAKFQEILTLFNGQIAHFMIGRGLIQKPYIAAQIKGEIWTEAVLKEKLQHFHEALFQEYESKLHASHLIMKMRGFWEYFSHSFQDQHKVFKAIKKSKNIKNYHTATSEIFTKASLHYD